MDATTILTIIILLATAALLWTLTGGRQQQPNHDGQRASLGLSRREPSAQPIPRWRSSMIRHPPESGKSPQTHTRGTGAREGGDMNWTATFATRSLLAFCVGVLALSALPSSASSQQGWSHCRNHPSIFGSTPVLVGGVTVGGDWGYGGEVVMTDHHRGGAYGEAGLAGRRSGPGSGLEDHPG